MSKWKNVLKVNHKQQIIVHQTDHNIVNKNGNKYSSNLKHKNRILDKMIKKLRKIREKRKRKHNQKGKSDFKYSMINLIIYFIIALNILILKLKKVNRILN